MHPPRRHSHIKVGLLAARANLLQLFQNSRKVLLQVILQAAHAPLLHPKHPIRLGHVCREVLTAAQQIGKRQSIRRIPRPLETTQHPARRLQHPHGHVPNLGIAIRQRLAQTDHLLRRVPPRTSHGQRLSNRLRRAQTRHRHLGRVHGVQIGRLGAVRRAPHGLLLQNRHRVVANNRLHKASQAEDSVVHARLLQELLRALLDVHQRHLRVLVAVHDGEEDVALDPHCLRGLDQCHLALPVHHRRRLLRTRRRTVDDRVDAHQRRRDGRRVRQIHLDGRRTPVTQKVCRVLTRTHRAANLVALVQRFPHNLATKSSSRADHQDGILRDRRATSGCTRRRRTYHGPRPRAALAAGKESLLRALRRQGRVYSPRNTKIGLLNAGIRRHGRRPDARGHRNH
mmetsp:Transcript_5317/g.15195  ORF Transcript_5317/g.15195 Transcript_5317/m.15195 type:complete len:398 (+) Transcript_5317:83-1276(+)